MMPELRFDVLPAAQRTVWEILSKCADQLHADNYYLAGGTALALQLGHRQSVDFDFFSQKTGLADSTLAWLEKMPDFVIRSIDPETIHGNCRQVKLSFIGEYKYPLLDSPLTADRMSVASLLDIGLMKFLSITHRATVRDYIDLAALFKHGCALSTLLEASKRKYGTNFNPMVPLRALTAFDDVRGDMPIMLDTSLSSAWQDIIRKEVCGTTIA